MVFPSSFFDKIDGAILHMLLVLTILSHDGNSFGSYLANHHLINLPSHGYTLLSFVEMMNPMMDQLIDDGAGHVAANAAPSVIPTGYMVPSQHTLRINQFGQTGTRATRAYSSDNTRNPYPKNSSSKKP